jgi:hypothetical protein
MLPFKKQDQKIAACGSSYTFALDPALALWPIFRSTWPVLVATDL